MGIIEHSLSSKCVCGHTRYLHTAQTNGVVKLGECNQSDCSCDLMIIKKRR